MSLKHHGKIFKIKDIPYASDGIKKMICKNIVRFVRTEKLYNYLEKNYHQENIFPLSRFGIVQNVHPSSIEVKFFTLPSVGFVKRITIGDGKVEVIQPHDQCKNLMFPELNVGDAVEFIDPVLEDVYLGIVKNIFLNFIRVEVISGKNISQTEFVEYLVINKNIINVIHNNKRDAGGIGTQRFIQSYYINKVGFWGVFKCGERFLQHGSLPFNTPEILRAENKYKLRV